MPGNTGKGLSSGSFPKLSPFVFNCTLNQITQFPERSYRSLTAHQQNGVFKMKCNLRQTTWAFAISASLLCTPGFAQGYQLQDNRGQGQDRGQDDKRGDQQQADRHDNVQNDQHNDRHDNNQDDRYARNGAPEGGYRQTCQDVRTVGNTLQANCQKKNGQWKQASLRNFNQCNSQIENNNGKLVCSR
jgi:hypothetical protein